jgi:alkylated DNA repair dioxygenase AlkB
MKPQKTLAEKLAGPAPGTTKLQRLLAIGKKSKEKQAVQAERAEMTPAELAVEVTKIRQEEKDVRKKKNIVPISMAPKAVQKREADDDEMRNMLRLVREEKFPTEVPIQLYSADKPNIDKETIQEMWQAENLQTQRLYMYRTIARSELSSPFRRSILEKLGGLPIELQNDFIDKYLASKDDQYGVYWNWWLRSSKVSEYMDSIERNRALSEDITEILWAEWTAVARAITKEDKVYTILLEEHPTLHERITGPYQEIAQRLGIPNPDKLPPRALAAALAEKWYNQSPEMLTKWSSLQTKAELISKSQLDPEKAVHYSDIYLKLYILSSTPRKRNLNKLSLDELQEEAAKLGVVDPHLYTNRRALLSAIFERQKVIGLSENFDDLRRKAADLNMPYNKIMQATKEELESYIIKASRPGKGTKLLVYDDPMSARIRANLQRYLDQQAMTLLLLKKNNASPQEIYNAEQEYIKRQTAIVIYDNQERKMIESLGVGFDVSRIDQRAILIDLINKLDNPPPLDELLKLNNDNLYDLYLTKYREAGLRQDLTVLLIHLLEASKVRKKEVEQKEQKEQKSEEQKEIEQFLEELKNPLLPLPKLQNMHDRAMGMLYQLAQENTVIYDKQLYESLKSIQSMRDNIITDRNKLIDYLSKQTGRPPSDFQGKSILELTVQKDRLAILHRRLYEQRWNTPTKRRCIDIHKQAKWLGVKVLDTFIHVHASDINLIDFKLDIMRNENVGVIPNTFTVKLEKISVAEDTIDIKIETLQMGKANIHFYRKCCSGIQSQNGIRWHGPGAIVTIGYLVQLGPREYQEVVNKGWLVGSFASQPLPIQNPDYSKTHNYSISEVTPIIDNANLFVIIQTEKLFDEKQKYVKLHSVIKDKDYSREALDKPVNVDSINVARHILSTFLNKLQPNLYGPHQAAFIDSVIREMATDNTNASLFANLALFVTYIRLSDAKTFRRNLRQGNYTPEMISRILLQPAEILPEIFNDTVTEEAQRLAADRIVKLTRDLTNYYGTYLYYRLDPLARKRSGEISLNPLSLELVNSKVPIQNCIGGVENQNIPPDRIVLFREDEKLYCIDIDQLRQGIFTNPHTGKPLPPDLINLYVITYYDTKTGEEITFPLYDLYQRITKGDIPKELQINYNGLTKALTFLGLQPNYTEEELRQKARAMRVKIQTSSSDPDILEKRMKELNNAVDILTRKDTRLNQEELIYLAGRVIRGNNWSDVVTHRRESFMRLTGQIAQCVNAPDIDPYEKPENVTFYRDPNDGRKYCFTNVMLERILNSNVNPYTNQELDKNFVEKQRQMQKQAQLLAKIPPKISEETKANIDDLWNELFDILDKSLVKEKLEEKSEQLVEKLPGGMPGGMPGGLQPPAGDDDIDALFEERDEETAKEKAAENEEESETTSDETEESEETEESDESKRPANISESEKKETPPQEAKEASKAESNNPNTPIDLAKYAFPQVEGLYIIPNYLSSEETSNLLRKIDDQTWNSESARRVQQYGYKYISQNEKVEIKDAPAPPEFLKKLQENLLAQKIFPEMPDQIIINEYEPGQGILPHIDNPEYFGPVVASLSLGSEVPMDFSKNGRTVTVAFPVGSLIILTGPARNEWSHSIPSRKTDPRTDGKKGRTTRQRHVTVTFRIKNKDSGKMGFPSELKAKFSETVTFVGPVLIPNEIAKEISRVDIQGKTQEKTEEKTQEKSEGKTQAKVLTDCIECNGSPVKVCSIDYQENNERVVGFCCIDCLEKHKFVFPPDIRKRPQ